MTHLLRLLGFIGMTLGGAAAAADLSMVKLLPGVHIELYAKELGARPTAVAEPLCAVFVGTRGGELFAVRDADRKADEVVTVLSGQHVANGIAWKDGAL
jgi:hypothetical protein